MERKITGTGGMAELADLRDKPAFTGEETKEQILEEGVSPYHKADIVAAKEEVSH